ncbi:MAG: bifunctional demethylmenaquinone methyltransferase/2-methoxy-6-polyprenyl-1,4-benzoquinol methylase UbiE [Gammaproteobacteria bacterium]
MNKPAKNVKTHFGYEEVELKDKSRRVANVFHSVAQKYDLMNDVMSFGVHRIWKRLTVEISDVKPGEKVLDIAAGTGDLCDLFARRLGRDGELIAVDINDSMLKCGRSRLTDRGHVGMIKYVQADAEQLPFPDNYFDYVSIAFGLRNVSRKERALESMLRVLKPGGRLLVLEFSHTELPLLKSIYDLYSFRILPKMGKLLADDEDSYRYLAESIRMHPDQETLKTMMEAAGFDQCSYLNFSGGIVSLHKGYKF